MLDYLQTGAIRSKAYGYDCPADQQLDVSWHVGQNAVGGAWSEFLMRPSIEGAVEAVKWAVDNSGIWELKQIRDMVGGRCCWGAAAGALLLGRCCWGAAAGADLDCSGLILHCWHVQHLQDFV